MFYHMETIRGSFEIETLNKRLLCNDSGQLVTSCYIVNKECCLGKKMSCFFWGGGENRVIDARFQSTKFNSA